MTQEIYSSPATCQSAHLQEAGTQVEEMELEPGTLIQDVDLPKGYLTAAKAHNRTFILSVLTLGTFLA